MSRKKRTFFLFRLIFMINIFFGVIFLLSYLSPFINPQNTSLFAFGGLAYFPLLIINVAFIIFWLFFKAKYTLLSIIIILIGYNTFLKHFQFKHKEDKSLSRSINIVSYNIQNFNTGKYGLSIDLLKSNTTLITKFLKDQKADIICLQEFEYAGKGKESFLKQFSKEVFCSNYIRENYFDRTKSKFDGLLILSSYPFINTYQLKHEEKTIAIAGDFLIGKDTNRIINIHLASIYLNVDDYQFLSELSTNQENFEIKSRNILSKINAAYKKRSQQTEVIYNFIKDSPFPIILMGDFNDTPASYTYNKITRLLDDSFMESGTGLGNSFSLPYFPPLRIDYIFHDTLFTSNKFRVHQIPFSDHYAISCEIGIQ